MRIALIALLLAASPAAAREVTVDSDLLEFTFSWPKEAEEVPALAARFEKRLAEVRASATAAAEEDRKERAGGGIDYNPHFHSEAWETLGQSEALLSLAADIGTFTGGAHGNSIFEAILWDRQAGREMEVADLFAQPAAAFAAMTPVYCAELDKQRAEKRQETLPLQGEGFMVDCRPLAEQVVAPVDADKDGRFELLRVLIEPYNSGPYVEGTYEVDVPVTEAVRALVKEAYRESF